MKKNRIDMEMFCGVNGFPGIDRSNLYVEGDTDVYVPYTVKELWFRAVHSSGCVKCEMVSSIEEIARLKLCVFKAEVFDGAGKMLSMGYGSASTDEPQFVETAERRAKAKALTSAGFTWHNGDFSQDTDVAKSYLDRYQTMLNSGFDITNADVLALYDDALITILPDGYDADSGKPIAAMTEARIEKIGKNYGLLTTGDPVANAKIAFVYRFNMLKKEAEKSVEEPADMAVSVTAADLTVPAPEEKQKRTRNNKKKEKPVKEPEIEADVPVAEAEETAEQEATAEADESVEESTEETAVVAETEAEPDTPAAEAQETVEQGATEEMVAEEVAEEAIPDDIFSMSAEDDVAASEKFADIKVEDGDEEPPFSENGFYPIEGVESPFNDEITEDKFDFGDVAIAEVTPEILKKHGYEQESDLTADWKGYLQKIRETNTHVDWSDYAAAKRYVEELPIFNNFIWREKAEKNNIVLLGDFINRNKEAVAESLKDGTMQLETLRKPIQWYLSNVQDPF